MNDVFRRAAASVVLVAAPLGLGLVWLPTRHGLPGRIATHWNLSGHPDRFGAPGPLTAWMAVAAGVVALLGVLLLWSRRGVAKAFLAPIAMVAWVLAAGTCDTLLVAHGRRDIRLADSPLWHTVVVLAVAGVALGAVWWLTPQAGSRYAAAGVPTSPISLAPGERAVWVGSASAPLFLCSGLVLVAAGVVALVLREFWGVPMAIVGLASLWLHRVDVRVDESGFTAHLGGLPWPGFHTPMAQILSARVETIRARNWGGWGYRVSRRGTGIVLHNGPGLVLARTGGDLAVTVDHPEQGVDLVNAYLAARTSSSS